MEIFTFNRGLAINNESSNSKSIIMIKETSLRFMGSTKDMQGGLYAKNRRLNL